MESEINSETLARFLDGELPPEEMDYVAKVLAKRPDLDAWVSRQEYLRADLREAFSEVMNSPVPPKLLAVVRHASISKRWLVYKNWEKWKFPVWASVAAALAAGLIIAFIARSTTELVKHRGQIMASGPLAEALDHRLASAGYDGVGTRIGLSFRGHNGHDCRTFNDGKQAGLACHQPNGWAVAMLVSHPESPSGSYRMAGSEMPDAIRQAVMARIAGAPFDAATEKAARDRGWR